MVLGLDSNIILNSAILSRKGVNLGFLRYAKYNSTSDKFQGENESEVWIFFVMFWFDFFHSPRKGKDYVFINNLEHLSGVITHNEESRFGIYRGTCLPKPSHYSHCFCQL